MEDLDIQNTSAKSSRIGKESLILSLIPWTIFFLNLLRDILGISIPILLAMGISIITFALIIYSIKQAVNSLIKREGNAVYPALGLTISILYLLMFFAVIVLNMAAGRT